MSTLRANGDMGLNIDLGATKQRKVLFNLTQEVYHSPTILFNKKFAKSAFLNNFATFHVNKCPLYGQMANMGLKSITRGNKAAGLNSVTSHKKLIPAQPSSSRKNSLSQHFLQFCFIPGEQMSTLWANGDMGLKIDLGQQSSGKYSLTSHKRFTKPNHPLQEKIR